MQEKKVINLLIIISILLSLMGVFFVFEKGWTQFDFFSAFIGGLNDKVDKISSLRYLPDLVGIGQEKTYLLLFQNNLELRPSGGYLGSFAILKINNAKITHLGIHDTNIFDGFSQAYTQPPQPLADYLGIDNWQMRDANWSPDFLVSAMQIEDFYHLQGGQESFDGIIAVNASVLPKILEVTGPVYLSEFDKEFKAEDVLYQLEYEVEKNYFNRGIDPGERKTALKSLIRKIFAELTEKKYLSDSAMKDLVIQELDKKNILIYLKDGEIQEFISQQGWSGEVDRNFQNNYLMLVEANLRGKKSNAFVSRQVDYKVDDTGQRTKVDLQINFDHNNSEKDWFNDDYRCYLRIYLPKGSWLVKSSGIQYGPDFGEDLDKLTLGAYVIIPAGESKTVSFTYLLPEGMGRQAVRSLLIQKQPGIDSIEYYFKIKRTGGEYVFNKLIWQDELISLP